MVLYAFVSRRECLSRIIDDIGERSEARKRYGNTSRCGIVSANKLSSGAEAGACVLAPSACWDSFFQETTAILPKISTPIAIKSTDTIRRKTWRGSANAIREPTQTPSGTPKVSKPASLKSTLPL